MGTIILMYDSWKKDGDPVVSPIRVLILDDTPADTERMVRELRDAGFTPSWERVDTEEDFLTQLAFAPDLILADYALPRCHGLRALRILRRFGLAIPCILVSGPVGEETAVSCLHEGATDYILKDHLERLGEAVTRALEQKRLDDEKQVALAARARLAAIVDSSDDAIISIALDGAILTWNAGAERAYGYTASEVAGQPLTLLLPQVRGDEVLSVLERVGTGEHLRHFQTVWKHKDGTALDVSLTLSPLRDASGRESGIAAVARDITTLRRAEELLRAHARQQEVVAYLGRSALAGVDFDVLSAEAVSLAAQALHVPQCVVLEFHAERRIVRVRAGTRSPDVASSAWMIPAEETDLEGFMQLYDGPCIIEDARDIGHIEMPLLAQLGARSGVTVPIRGSGPAYGILGAYSVQPKPYTRTDVAFLQAIANVLAACWEFRGDPEVRTKIEESRLPSNV